MAQQRHVIVSKFGDHLLICRQTEIFKRQGIHLDRGTHGNWIEDISRGDRTVRWAVRKGRPRVSETCAAPLRAILNGRPESGIEDLMPWRVQQPSSLAAQGYVVALAIVTISPKNQRARRAG